MCDPGALEMTLYGPNLKIVQIYFYVIFMFSKKLNFVISLFKNHNIQEDSKVVCNYSL